MKSAVAPVLLSVSQSPGDAMVKMIVTMEKMKKTVATLHVARMSSLAPVAAVSPGTLCAMDRMTVTMAVMSWTVLHRPAVPTSSSAAPPPASRSAGCVTMTQTVPTNQTSLLSSVAVSL